MPRPEKCATFHCHMNKSTLSDALHCQAIHAEKARRSKLVPPPWDLRASGKTLCNSRCSTAPEVDELK